MAKTIKNISNNFCNSNKTWDSLKNGNKLFNEKNMKRL